MQVAINESVTFVDNRIPFPRRYAYATITYNILPAALGFQFQFDC